MRLFKYSVLALAVVLGTSVVLLAAVNHETAPFLYTSVSSVPHAQVALVLGASVIGTSTLSHVLAERADLAVLLYKQHFVSKILVTGDNGELSHNEVDPVGRYLIARGIPEADVFLDHAGFDTYSSMYRAREVFAVSSMIVVSQPFHLPRSVFIARTLGIDAVGLAATEGEPYTFNRLREVPATIKALFDLTTWRVPKYLGPQYVIWGSATSTWPQ